MKKKAKEEFYILESDAKEFHYEEFYYISDIKDELNRICSAEGTKKITLTKIWDFLTSENLVKEENTDGTLVKTYTDKGLDMGVKTVDKVSAAGTAYKLLMYPDEAQKMVVQFFTHSTKEDDRL